MTFIAFIIGFALIVALGTAHHFGMLWILRMTPHAEHTGHKAVLFTFVGLLTLHTSEILAFAGVFALLLQFEALGAFGGSYRGTWADLIYFSGINFVTLGFTDIDTIGPLRLIGMFQSLGGFMVLTWSATLIFSVSGTAWHEGGYEEDEASDR
ncbi:ion channel [Fulvimarina sp. 2208YS6-2-32]|uniref:Ion channel n=1 Tax=Fulvimarina uroteuthidis TaxID=3098149 RepID=A0ABU5HZQ9_9HYPH|nr:ion channel [Fulvimarina sp. 2208YS6-2-32]MDY8108619.1 ion channel [Fulvimarina sp. 2208YS6-2-32]